MLVRGATLPLFLSSSSYPTASDSTALPSRRHQGHLEPQRAEHRAQARCFEDENASIDGEDDDEDAAAANGKSDAKRLPASVVAVVV